MVLFLGKDKRLMWAGLTAASVAVSQRLMSEVRSAVRMAVAGFVLINVTVLSNTVLSNTAMADDVVTSAEKALVTSYQHASKVQQKIDRLDEQTRQDYYEYLYTTQRAKQLEDYNAQLQRLIDSQQQEIEDIKEQLSSLQETEEAALPLLQTMLNTLIAFVERDKPFLSAERSERLSRLNDVLARADVSVAEKYRQVLEAYQIEVEYGRTLEAYSGVLKVEGQPDRDVTFLRLGRVALYYQTSDGQESGQWQTQQQQWQRLDERHDWVVQKGIQMALQQTVPELLELPIGLISELSKLSEHSVATSAMTEKGGAN
ncbi:DUF3450 domain-containing protein [Litoribrevibacter albus]|uniref:DUF3450 domain-containing protein n=2 Tax=Litoribrevibacter albus TaxID=1473156 RepID=A0AA37SDX4_9GAMM|nr:DUF3450 domain-containing protein [Litoribrevibacter albus]